MAGVRYQLVLSMVETDVFCRPRTRDTDQDRRLLSSLMVQRRTRERGDCTDP